MGKVQEEVLDQAQFRRGTRLTETQFNATSSSDGENPSQPEEGCDERVQRWRWVAAGSPGSLKTKLNVFENFSQFSILI